MMYGTVLLPSFFDSLLFFSDFTVLCLCVCFAYVLFLYVLRFFGVRFFVFSSKYVCLYLFFLFFFFFFTLSVHILSMNIFLPSLLLSFGALTSQIVHYSSPLAYLSQFFLLHNSCFLPLPSFSYSSNTFL